MLLKTFSRKWNGTCEALINTAADFHPKFKSSIHNIKGCSFPPSVELAVENDELKFRLTVFTFQALC